jgi:serine protease
VKTSIGFKFVIACSLLAPGLLWLLGRGSGDGDANKEAPAYADTLPGFEPGDTDATPGEIVVDFADDIAPAAIAAWEARLALRFVPASRYSDNDRIYRAVVDPDRVGSDLAELRRDPLVEAAEENHIYSIPEVELANTVVPADELTTPTEDSKFPNDPRYGEQWHMRQIHMDETWKAAQGEGVIVAVVDTGVSRVSDLAQTEFVPGWNFVDNNANAADDHGHGTHVAGTIAQSTHNGIGVTGVAYKAKIMPIKVLSGQGSGTVSGIAEGIRWAADNGAKVINMSLGGRMSSQVLGKAVKYAHDKGVTVVCAAGNDGKGRVSYPAAYPGAVAVAATQKDEATAFYSNWGKQIDIAAPGGNTRSDPTGGVLQNTLYAGKDDYFFFMGTSMASPHVAGVAALVVGAGVSDPDKVEQILKETARRPKLDANAPDYAEHYGAGIIDAAAAVRKAQLGQGGLELGVATGLAALVLLGLRRRHLLGHFGLGGALALVLGASGFFFLPQLFGGSDLPGMNLLTRGIPAWDGALLPGGAAAHGNVLFYSALLPIGLAVLGYGWKRARGIIAGLALGIAGHLLAQTFLGTVDIHWMPLDNLWLALNGFLAAIVGYAVARK